MLARAASKRADDRAERFDHLVKVIVNLQRNWTKRQKERLHKQGNLIRVLKKKVCQNG